MKTIYVSGPLSSRYFLKRAFNIYRAWKAAWRFWRAGYAVICPHTNTGLVNLFCPWLEQSAQWLDGYCAMVRRLQPGDAIYMVPGWQNSKGATKEREIALKMPGVEVLYNLPPKK